MFRFDFSVSNGEVMCYKQAVMMMHSLDDVDYKAA